MWINTFRAESYGNRGMYFWEPIPISGIPADAKPYCCYLSMVIFYDRADWNRGVITELIRHQSMWNLLGQRWTDEDIGWAALAPWVSHEGAIFELGGGEVVYQDGQWWHKWLGWRLSGDDRRFAHYLKEQTNAT